MFDAWCMVPFFSTPPVDLSTSPGFEATGWGLRPVFGRITRGEVAPAPAWRKETKGIIATYMALVLRSPWKLNTTWRFRTISDLTAMDVMGNVEHEPQTWVSYVFIIFIHSIQWNPLKTCLLSPSVPIKGLRSKKLPSEGDLTGICFYGWSSDWEANSICEEAPRFGSSASVTDL